MIFLKFLFMTLNVFAQVGPNQAQDSIYVNEIINGGAENGLTKWTASTGVTASTPNWAVPSRQFGKKYFNLVFDGIASRQFETIISLPTTHVGQFCSVVFYTYANAGSPGYVGQVRDSSNNVIGSVPILSSATSVPLKHTVNFVCPSSGSEIKFRLLDITGASRTFRLDNVSLFLYNQESRKFYQEGSIVSDTGAAVSINFPTGSSFSVLESSNMRYLPKIGTNITIACANGSVSGGNTCPASDEGVGIVVNFPKAGRFRVCTKMNIGQDSDSESHSVKMARTSPASTTITEEPNNIIYINGQSSNFGSFIVDLCETWEITQSGSTAFRIYTNRDNSAGSDFDLVESTTIKRNQWTVEEL